MKEKQRVPKGKMYWFLAYDSIRDKGINVLPSEEECCIVDFNRCELGNYFHTKEEAEAMARKLRAVLKGADVVENQDYDTVLNDMRQLILAQCKEWLETNIANQVEMMCAEGPLMMSKTTFLADFENEILKLWEDEK